jgi:segregation and condensation protein A
MSYRVKLQNFEGPLDLLLFLIRKNEVDIYNIPIALITRQYLEYIRIMEELDLEVASEFIVMAATLIRIKAQMLLPKPNVEEEIEEIDPRQELVERLLEYRKYKEIAHELARQESVQLLHFPRSAESIPEVEDAPTEREAGSVSLFDLVAAFYDVMKRLENQPVHRVIAPEVSVEEQMDFIVRFIGDREQASFTELMQHVHVPTRAALVATFMALLELIRRRQVLVKQPRPFAEIWIFRPEVNN